MDTRSHGHRAATSSSSSAERKPDGGNTIWASSNWQNQIQRSNLVSIPAARTTSLTKSLFIIMGPACRHLQEASQEVGDLVGRPCHNKSNHSLSSISSHLPISCSRCFSLMIDSITALRVSTLVIFFTFRPLHSPSWVALYVHFIFFFTLVLLAFHPLEPGIFTVFILVCYNILYSAFDSLAPLRVVHPILSIGAVRGVCGDSRRGRTTGRLC